MNMQQHVHINQYGEEKVILRFFTICILQFHRMNQFLIKLSKPSHQNAFLATEGTEVAFGFGWHKIMNSFKIDLNKSLSFKSLPSKHEDGVWDEVGGVEETQHRLGVILLLAVNLRYPGVAELLVLGAVQELGAVLHDGDRLPGVVL